ncbi:TlpA disulfide reductase family protein [Nibrella saemangeumensis]|uniref:TlpA disulfide reductase family protein n=1 Tax=Nibrella saemangeumensis TaxID=1084526 RepID=A0ABP8MBB1_9BACT
MDLNRASSILFLWLINIIGYGQSLQNPDHERQFTIIGRIEGLKDQTKLFLFDYDTQKDIDSTFSKNNQFVLRGKRIEPKQLAISTALPDYHAVGFFWVDNDTVHLSGTLLQFKQAVLSGSKTEDEHRRYKALLVPFHQKRDSLTALKRKLQYKDSVARREVENGFIALETQTQAIKIEFIKQSPDSYVSAEFLRLFTLTKDLPKSQIQSLYLGLSNRLQRSAIGQRIREYLELSQDLAIGNHYIDFTQFDLAGNPVKVSDYKGKYVLLEFWGSGCVPCRAENPQMVELYKKYHPQELEIIGISLDIDKDRWRKAVEQDQLPWPQLSDLKGAYNKGVLIYNVPAMPSNFLIDSNGIIIGRDLRREKLKDKLAELFKKFPSH